VIITDKLTSYGAAKQEMLPGVEHRQHRYLNNRAEKSHQPTRQRDRRLQGFTSPGHAQCFSPPMVPSPNTSARDVTASESAAFGSAGIVTNSPWSGPASAASTRALAAHHPFLSGKTTAH
jgi:DDE domain